MKILQLIHKSQNRGAETFGCQLANHLIALGHYVKVIAVYNGEADLPFKGKIITLNGSSNKRFMDVPAWKKLAGIIKKFNPDIVQANAGDTLKCAVFSKLFFGWENPIVSRNASEVGRYLKSSIQKKLNSFFYKKVDYVISVSEATEKDLLNHFPFLSGKTEIIPVGLENIISIDKLNLQPIGSQHIVHVGGFTFEKNHTGLINIFKVVLKTHSNVHLHLVGDGPLKPEMENLVNKLNLSEKVTFYGFVNNPMSYIKAADTLVLPSIIEGLPGVLLEAMYCKTPVVAYNVGGVSEIVTAKTEKLIVKNDEGSFAAAINKNLKRPDQNQIESDYQMVIKEFMNAQITLKFVKAYEKIVGG